MTISGSLTNDQFVGHAPDITGLTVTAHYSDSTLDHEVDSADLTVTPAEYDEAGTQTLSISYTDEYGTAEATQSVTVLAVELSALAVTGDFTDTQYTGSAPTKTGLTFTASYNDGTSDTVSASDISVSPVAWDASGNPNNLGSQTATFSYTEDGVTKTATKSVVIHRPETGLSLTVGTAGHIYLDMSAAEHAESWKGASTVAQSGASIGDHVCLLLPSAYYDEEHPDIKYPGSQLMADVTAYGVVLQNTGEPGTAGFIPAWGPANNTDLEDSYFAVSIDNTGSALTGDTVHILIGTLEHDVTAGVGWSLSDFSSTGLRDIVVTLTV